MRLTHKKIERGAKVEGRKRHLSEGASFLVGKTEGHEGNCE